MSEVLYQKIGIAVNQLALDLLTRQTGDRIPPISEYQEKFQVSRGTVQNALSFLKEQQAIALVSRGHLGTYIEKLDYRRLQECSFNKELLGSMPLPYSSGYQGLATALFQLLSPYAFNLVYARGAESRLKMVTSGLCQFTVCSRHAAEEAIRNHMDVAIAVDLGPETYLSRHVLVLRDPAQRGICDGMRIACDKESPDHRHITQQLAEGYHNLQYVDIKAHHTIRAIMSGDVDAGVWNLDEIIESGYQGLNVVPIDGIGDLSQFSTAVLVVNRKDKTLESLLSQHIHPKTVRDIQQAVRLGSRAADY